MELVSKVGRIHPMDGMMEIKLKLVLNREIKRRNESVNSMAAACGIPQSTLHNWCQGTLPTAKNLHFIKALSDHLGQVPKLVEI
ncbi:MAG: hypothetical protein AABZ06_02365 [Bdellovibrionota bacterium]